MLARMVVGRRPAVPLLSVVVVLLTSLLMSLMSVPSLLASPLLLWSHGAVVARGTRSESEIVTGQWRRKRPWPVEREREVEKQEQAKERPRSSHHQWWSACA